MEGDELKKQQEDIGKLGQMLHNPSKLPTLRTYQGDTAQFIKEKNESVTSIALKEKARREALPAEEKPTQKTPHSGSRIASSVLVVVVSLLLLGGASGAIYYIIYAVKQRTVAPIVVTTAILPYSQVITLENVTATTIAAELAQTEVKTGVNVVSITSVDGSRVDTTHSLLTYLKTVPPAQLDRNLQDTYMLGILSSATRRAPFFLIQTKDFGTAFSGMLDWETHLEKDLGFLIAPRTASSSPSVGWKDVVVKNKDSRVLMDASGEVVLAYTFLDKTSVLITNSLSAISDLSAIYVSRAIAR